MQHRHPCRLIFFNRYLDGLLGFFQQRVGFAAGGAGGGDLLFHLLDRRVVGQEEGQAHQVGGGDGGIHRGGGVQIHQLADDRQAQIREQQFARNSLGRQDGEAGGADVLRLFRLNQSRQAADGADGGGDDIAGLDNPRRAAGRFLAGDDMAGGRAVRREVANLDVVKRQGGLRREHVFAQAGDIAQRFTLTPQQRKQALVTRAEILGVKAVKVRVSLAAWRELLLD